MQSDAKNSRFRETFAQKKVDLQIAAADCIHNERTAMAIKGWYAQNAHNWIKARDNWIEFREMGTADGNLRFSFQSENFAKS